MLGRQIFGYAPSLIISGFVSFATVSLLTRLLPPEEYGQYVLAINAMSMLLGVAFFWLQSAASRLLPQAIKEEREPAFTATLYALYALSSLGLIVVMVIIVTCCPLGDWRVAAWFAPPLAILRALLNLNQAYHRTHTQISRYNILEIGQAVIGLLAIVALILLVHSGAVGAALGAMLGLAVMCLVDWRTLATIRWNRITRDVGREIFHFGWPFIINYGLSFVLSRSDSFLIQIFRGSAEVGLYNAGYAFPDRIGQYLFMAVATASLPLTVRRLEREGIDAARQQTYINGVAILALAVPACVGLLFANRAIADLLIGADFRAGAVQVMPWITVAMIINGLAAHYFDHALHLAKKTRLFFYTLGPAALFNFLANLYVIPHYGFIGAAWTTLAAYMVYLTLSISVGRRVFAIQFPFKPALQVASATAVMAAVLGLLDFPESLMGLCGMITVGAAVYGLCVLAFDLMGLRTRVMKRLRPARKNESETFYIVSSLPAFEALADPWRALYQSLEPRVFGNYDDIALWWRHMGEPAGATLHIVVMCDAQNKLKAILPLAVRRINGVRVAEWAGGTVFDNSDAIVAASEDSQRILQKIWAFTLAQGRFDIAVIKDMAEGSLSLPVLSASMQPHTSKDNYVVRLDGLDGDAWLAAQSRKLRGDTRRKMEKMGTHGTVAFHVHDNAQAVPDFVLDALYNQKKEWFIANRKQGVFASAGMALFLQDLACEAARRDSLYLGWLSCGDKVVACHMGFVTGGVLYLYHTTYDAAFGTFSPGNALMVETIQWAANHHLTAVDFMRGEEPYKARFANQTRRLQSFIAARSWVGKIALVLRKH